jgi:hypothetical protein
MRSGSAELQSVLNMYSLLLQWCSGCEFAIIAGDLNETRATIDRSLLLGGSVPARAICHLLDAGFVDCYRSLHDDPGFTCSTPVAGGSIARSRIDYVLARG